MTSSSSILDLFGWDHDHAYCHDRSIAILQYIIRIFTVLVEDMSLCNCDDFSFLARK